MEDQQAENEREQASPRLSITPRIHNTLNSRNHVEIASRLASRSDIDAPAHVEADVPFEYGRIKAQRTDSTPPCRPVG
jgi:hypothetical protein